MRNELRKGFKDGQVLGDDNFLNNIRDKNKILIENPLRFKEIIEAACHVLNISKELIIFPGKSQKASFAWSIISLIAFETANISIEHIASYLSQNVSRISGLISRTYMRSRNSPKERSIFDDLRNQVLQIAGSKAWPRYLFKAKWAKMKLSISKRIITDNEAKQESAQDSTSSGVDLKIWFIKGR